jgi:hypothetical protein
MSFSSQGPCHPAGPSDERKHLIDQANFLEQDRAAGAIEIGARQQSQEKTPISLVCPGDLSA